MISQPPESRFAGLLKSFFDSIGQTRTSATYSEYIRFTPQSRPTEFSFARSEKGQEETHALQQTRLLDDLGQRGASVSAGAGRCARAVKKHYRSNPAWSPMVRLRQGS